MSIQRHAFETGQNFAPLKRVAGLIFCFKKGIFSVSDNLWLIGTEAKEKKHGAGKTLPYRLPDERELQNLLHPRSQDG
jgi:hypothetical protein